VTDTREALSARLEGVQRHYRAHAPHPGAVDTVTAAALPVTETILRWTGTGRRVLDLGCHDGDISALIRSAGNDVVGVDLPEMVEIARQRHGIAAMAHDLNRPFPFPDQSFDAVVAASILDDIPDDLGFLTDCWRVLVPGGRLILIVPNDVSLFRRIQTLLGRSSRDWNAPTNYHTLNCYTLAGIRTLVERAGFRVVEHAGCAKRFSKIPFRYQLERILPPSFATDLAVHGVRAAHP
jgi:ubiquinone/menaquinone biosynthesis C-methylase UbiE